MFIKTFKTAVALLLAVFTAANTAACSSSVMHSETYYDMFDTFVTVMAYEDDADEFEENCEMIKSTLYECSQLFDIYREYDGMNNLATVNKNAGVTPVAVDEKIVDLLDFSLGMYTATDGKLNVAMGSVLSLWHDVRQQNNKVPGSVPPPSAEELRAAAEHTDINRVKIDREAMTVYLEDSGMSLDVGAVAKGFAADIVADMLKQKGIEDCYAVNLGGNVIALGTKPGGEKWKVSVQSPYSEYSTHIAKIEVEDASLVSSGSYERKFEYDGVSYSHIIDPDTLMPSEHFDSVSVLGESSAVCDALSTALFCMPIEEGQALVDKTEGIEAMWVKDGVITRSRGFPSDSK